MSERKFTFIELHLDGETQFGPKAINDALPFGEKTAAEELEAKDDDAENGDDATTADDGSAGTVIGAVIALVVLIGLAAAAKKFRGDDEPELEDEDQPEVIVN
ncbi:hypothetical protein EA462_04710 [Natrarchaeobius halalkaliphilus]|uniref:Uncharacterized protein n=1 Tax=Natrarchaeobius halalkaliphilus TaxID=1679091 RepID=A0A3N6N090_9EURY|nr:hypothetical protein [Natrarchaeobius halalkaliphilus]RQG91292.1 hypothetical protein EA462_04710 [Natrarchaeobius halalkaliphilus]